MSNNSNNSKRGFMGKNRRFLAFERQFCEKQNWSGFAGIAYTI
jgi:hypothetical protein